MSTVIFDYLVFTALEDFTQNLVALRCLEVDHMLSHKYQNVFKLGLDNMLLIVRSGMNLGLKLVLINVYVQINCIK